MSAILRRAVLFDRDGVINQALVRDGKPYPPSGSHEFVLVDGIVETAEELRRRGYLLFVFTNQPDVARGTQSREQVEIFHRHILARLPITKVYSCFHDDADNCACRKPKPGMIYWARDEYELDLPGSWVVGDRWRDVEAGATAGCNTILIRYGYRERAARADHEVDRVRALLDIIK